MMIAAQAGELESTTAGMVVVLLILAVLTVVWVWAVWHLFREGRWKQGLKETALVTLWIGLLGGGGWLLSTQIGRARDVARQAIPEYCPQVRDDIRRGTSTLDAARAAVRQMQSVEPAIQTLDEDDLAHRLLRLCRERTGWPGFRVPRDTAPADTAVSDSAAHGGPASDGGPPSPLPGTGAGG